MNQETTKRGPGRPRADRWPLEPYTLKLETDIIDQIPSRQWAQEILSNAVKGLQNDEDIGSPEKN